LIFQSIDDKNECVGVYSEGKLYYENFPDDLSRTWKYTGAISDPHVEFAWLYAQGLSVREACPAELVDDQHRAQKRLKAYLKSFSLAKINMRDHCIFDLVPADFLKQFCEIKNQITEHVFNTYSRPAHYEHLHEIQKLLYKIKYQNLNLNNEHCKELYYSSANRARVLKLLDGPQFIDYNMFGTVTGRLTTNPGSFPMLTVQKDFRKLIKPNNDWFLSLDYNAAELRCFLALTDQAQPQEDMHDWNVRNIYHDAEQTPTRQEAKVRFFAWLYDPYSKDTISASHYDKEKLLDTWYDSEYIGTPHGRQIKVDSRRALNYLLQSTTSDLVLERAVALDKYLENKKSFISHIVHDEVVIDLADEDRSLVPEMKELFSHNKLDKFLVRLTCGKNYHDLKELAL